MVDNRSAPTLRTSVIIRVAIQVGASLARERVCASSERERLHVSSSPIKKLFRVIKLEKGACTGFREGEKLRSGKKSVTRKNVGGVKTVEVVKIMQTSVFFFSKTLF